MEYCYIYTLSDPITKEIRYIGKANNLKERYKNHINDARDIGTHKRNWINSLKKKDLKPEIEVLDYVEISKWQYWETFWINQFNVWGFNLLNYTDGGDGSTFGNKSSFKKGHKPWNNEKGNKFICEECSIEFKAPPASKRRFCSHNCNSINKRKNLNSGNFKKGSVVWNKGLKGRKLKPDKNVYQYSAYTGEFIKKWNTAKSAAEFLGCNMSGICQCCNNRAKSAGGFIWKYFEKEKIEIISNAKLKIK